MILIDTEALVVFILGLIAPSLLGKHRRASIYNIHHFNKLQEILANNMSRVIVLPNTWTEVDNLLNDNLRNDHKYKYIEVFRQLVYATTERYLETKATVVTDHFQQIGLADSQILACASLGDTIICADSLLADWVRAKGFGIFDFKKWANEN